MVILIFKKLISILLVLVLALSAAPVFAAANKDPYEGISLAKMDASSATGYSTSLGYLQNTGANQWYRYDSVDFGSVSPTSAELTVGTEAAYVSGNITIRIDDPTGPVIAEFTIPEAKGWNVPVLCKTTIARAVTGVHSVYLNTRPGPCNYFDIIFVQPPDPSNVYVEYDGEKDVYNDISKSEYRHDINVLGGLGINLSAENDGRLYPDLFMNRGKFADVLSQLLGVNYQGSEQVFADVPASYKYFAGINNTYSHKYMQGDGNGNFNPSSFITVQDAATALCKLLSYTPFAEAKGGYPFGYLAVAQEEGLLDGLDSQTTLTNGMAARLIKNAIEADYYDISIIGSEGSAGYVKCTDGILSKTKNIFAGEGVVGATNITYVNNPGSALMKNVVLIDGSEFTIGNTQAKTLLGYDCDFFYKPSDDENQLVYISPKSSSEETVILSTEADITTITPTLIEYTPDSAEKEIKLSLEDCHIIYNGVALDKVLSETLTFPFNGKIRYVDNKFAKDVLFIDEYKNIKIDGFAKSTTSITDAISGNTYSFNENAYNFYYTKDGAPANPTGSTVINGTVGILYQSVNSTGKKLARLIVEDNPVSGTVLEYNSNGTVIIEGNSYKVDAAAFTGLGLVVPYPGLKAKFHKNIFGEIVYYDFNVDSETLIGFLIDYGLSDPTSLNGIMQLKLVDGANNKVYYDFAKTCIIDGINRKSASEMNSALTAAVKETPVRYRLNDNNKVVMLDTIIQKTTRGENMNDLMKEGTTYASGLNWYSGSDAIYETTGTHTAAYLAASDIKLFSKPSDDEKWGFFAMSKMGLDAFGGTPYSYELNDIFVNVFVSGREFSSTGEVMFAFDKKTDFVNDEYEKCYKISGYNGGVTLTYAVKESAVKVMVDALKKGDYISLTPVEGEISTPFTVVMLADGAKSRTVGGVTLNASVYYDGVNVNGSSGAPNAQYSSNYLAGVISAKYDEYVQVKFRDPATNAMAYTYFKINSATQLTTRFNKSLGTLKGGYKGSELKVGDVVCVTTRYRALTSVHSIEDSALAQKVQ